MVTQSCAGAQPIDGSVFVLAVYGSRADKSLPAHQLEHNLQHLNSSLDATPVLFNPL